MTAPRRAFSFRSYDALRVALFALAALGAAAASGCAQEDYYCDASGCYRCDGVGCRLLEPPTRPMCHGDWECAAPTVCTTLGCAAECVADGDCPEGTVCRTGLCAAPQEPPPVVNPGTCTRNADCADASLVCQDGVCVVAPTPACSATDACPSGQSCVAGTCIVNTETCQFSFECGADHLCVNQLCTTSCAAGAACGVGETCDAASGTCVVTPPVTGVCTNDAACGAGRVCLDSSCYDGCTTDATCGAGRYCAAGVCRPDTRPHPFCASDADCAPGRPCIGGVCRTPCDTSATCAMFDVQFNFCGADSYCLTTNEVTTDCHAAADCTAGQACIDGICR